MFVFYPQNVDRCHIEQSESSSHHNGCTSSMFARNRIPVHPTSSLVQDLS